MLVTQLCLIMYPMHCSLLGSSVHGIFPGRNTGVSCHFLLQGIFLTQELNPGLLHHRQILLLSESESESYSVVSNSLRPKGLCSLWISPVLSAGVGRLSLLQGIFPTQGFSQGCLSHQYLSYICVCVCVCIV